MSYLQPYEKLGKLAQPYLESCKPNQQLLLGARIVTQRSKSEGGKFHVEKTPKYVHTT